MNSQNDFRSRLLHPGCPIRAGTCPRRGTRRRGKSKAIVAAGRSILVIVWHLLSDPGARYAGLGPGYYDTRISNSRKMRNHVRQLEALGYQVTIETAA